MHIQRKRRPYIYLLFIRRIFLSFSIFKLLKYNNSAFDLTLKAGGQGRRGAPLPPPLPPVERAVGAPIGQTGRAAQGSASIRVSYGASSLSIEFEITFLLYICVQNLF